MSLLSQHELQDSDWEDYILKNWFLWVLFKRLRKVIL